MESSHLGIAKHQIAEFLGGTGMIPVGTAEGVTGEAVSVFGWRAVAVAKEWAVDAGHEVATGTGIPSKSCGQRCAEGPKNARHDACRLAWVPQLLGCTHPRDSRSHGIVCTDLQALDALTLYRHVDSHAPMRVRQLPLLLQFSEGPEVFLGHVVKLA